MEIVLFLIRLFLAAIFLLAGVGKLLDLEGSEKAVKAFGTPEDFAKTFAIALPFAEIVFAVCLLFVANFVARRDRRFDFAFEFYRRNDLAAGAGKRAGLSLFRRDSLEPVCQKEFDSQYCFCRSRACSSSRREAKIRV